MTFRSIRVSGPGEDWSMEGESTIGEVTRPITGEIRRSGFGLSLAPGLHDEVVKVQLDMQFVEPCEPRDQAG
nr:hypothetical protein [Streptomyces beihaiensis]